MECIEVVVDGAAFETWVADGPTARELADQLLEAARSGTTVTVPMAQAQGTELRDVGTLVLRLGSASSVAVRLLGDSRTGAAMGISH